MDKAEYSKILLYRLKQELIFQLCQKVDLLELHELEQKDAIIKSVLTDCKREDALECDLLQEQQFYIYLDEKYIITLNKAIKEYKSDLLAKIEKAQKLQEQSPQYQVKKAWQEVKEAWKPAKKQIENSLINIGIFAGTGLRELAKASRPSKKDPFR